ncbi:beta-ketoacyl-ACP reductase [Streptomyces mirabilis]|jgi:3-oxoacyl-[acyl-carrier protein] reductase|uniref:SDR family oxidoreductase n=1 Tax=Streptomyces mirabilis TaxID=68239 RepID=UPI00167DF999|nr:SDR family NAD(P)-dependent oxidoreductase [Streptomyces mirabilis]GHD77475.1 beta-ketoacyl-ACP reductase [Streptomyces mirabilis]
MNSGLEPAETPAAPAGTLGGRVVVLTGAGRGLGLLTTRTLLEQGAQVIAGHRSPSEELAQLADKYGDRLRLVAGDVAQEETAVALVAASQEFGRLNVLIHNAAITRDQPLVRMPVEDWEEVHRTNLRGAFLTTKHALRSMMRGRYGRIVYVSSMAATLGNPGQAAYASSKAGLHGLALTVAQEYAAYNVRSVVLAPGILDTGLGATVPPDQLSHMVRNSLVGLGQGQQIADTIAFLAGPAADFINGTVIRADGGMRY